MQTKAAIKISHLKYFVWYLLIEIEHCEVPVFRDNFQATLYIMIELFVNSQLNWNTHFACN